MQAICDHKLRFCRVDINRPGLCSNYMAWVTSSLHHDLINNKEAKIIIDGMTFVGDNEYVKKEIMAVPFKGKVSGYEDTYNFHHSSLPITVECSFGVLVHRWGILRGPLNIPLMKVAPLMLALCSLHNYCIDKIMEMPGQC